MWHRNKRIYGKISTPVYFPATYTTDRRGDKAKARKSRHKSTNDFISFYNWWKFITIEILGSMVKKIDKNLYCFWPSWEFGLILAKCENIFGQTWYIFKWINEGLSRVIFTKLEERFIAPYQILATALNFYYIYLKMMIPHQSNGM